MAVQRSNESFALRKQDGGFDRQAVMIAASREARTMHTTFLPWNVCLSLGLRSTWEIARKSGLPRRRRPWRQNPMLVLQQEAAVTVDTSLNAFAQANRLSPREARQILRTLRRGGSYWGGGLAQPSFTLVLKAEGGVS